jgi:hypothetical protein
MFAALGISSAFLWLSASVASPNFKVNIWPPLAICGLMAVAGLYMMFAPDVERLPLPGRSSGAASRTRQSRVYERHVDDLHAFAAQAWEAIHIRSSGQAFPTTRPIPFAGPGADDFRAHFPQATALIELWNAEADGYAATQSRVQGLCYQVAGELVAPNYANALASLLQRVGIGNVDPTTVFWTTRGNLFAILSHPDDEDAYEMVCPVPDGPGAMDTILAVWRAINDFPQNPYVQAFRRRDEAKNKIRPLLTDALEAASKTHQPSGHCERCPQA